MSYPNIQIVGTAPVPSNTVIVDRDSLVHIDCSAYHLTDIAKVVTLLQPRLSGELNGHGYFLNAGFDWKIVCDSEKVLVLVPLKKKAE